MEREDIKQAVIKEFAEKLPQGSTQYIVGKIAMLRSEVTPRNFAISFYIDHEEQTQTIWLSHTIDAESAAWEVFYKLLGLEARDAVDAKNAELAESEIAFERQANILQAERTRSTKLVELCPKAFHKAYKQAQRNCSENRSYNPNDLYKEWVKDLQPEYRDALEAPKKGGMQG